MFAPMAVADVAVEMGPRNRRRVLRAAVVLAAIAALVVWGGGGGFLTGSGHHLGPSSSGSSGSSIGGGTVYAGTLFPLTQKLAYGMNARQVLRIDGHPTKIVRDQTGQTCWQYAVNQTYNGLRGPTTLNNVRVCFYGGLYTVYHYEFDGQWLGYGPPPKITTP